MLCNYLFGKTAKKQTFKKNKKQTTRKENKKTKTPIAILSTLELAHCRFAYVQYNNISDRGEINLMSRNSYNYTVFLEDLIVDNDLWLKPYLNSNDYNKIYNKFEIYRSPNKNLKRECNITIEFDENKIYNCSLKIHTFG
jgi:hypothetical protein